MGQDVSKVEFIGSFMIYTIKLILPQLSLSGEKCPDFPDVNLVSRVGVWEAEIIMVFK